ncbi:MAG: DUF5791 family protein [Halodesulfurarchaeum sp.]
MLIEQVEEPDVSSPERLYRRYREDLAAIVEEVGVDQVVAQTGIDRARIERLPDEEAALTLGEAASIFSLTETNTDGPTIEQDTRDQLLMQMSSAVVDVDAIASGLDLDLSGQEIQQKIEGRTPVTLDEFARILYFVQSNNPYR